MRHFTLFALLALSSFITGSPRRALAQWSSDPTVNTPVCTAPNDQTDPRIVSDGAGGFIAHVQTPASACDGCPYLRRARTSCCLGSPGTMTSPSFEIYTLISLRIPKSPRK